MSRPFSHPFVRPRAADTPRALGVTLAVALALALALALLTMFTAACADHPTTPTGATDTPALATAKSAGAGATVERTDFPFGFVGGGDPRDNLVFFVGPLDPVAAVSIKCPDPDIIAPVSPGARAQVVTTPSGRVQIQAITREAHIAVWQFTGPVFSYCQLIPAPVVATGVVTYKVHTANADAFAGAGGPGAAPWRVSAVGTVDLTGGGQAHLEATARIFVRPDGTLVRDEERISLTPL